LLNGLRFIGICEAIDKDVQKMASEFAVIGGAGFIGSHFVESLLKTGKSVSVIDNFCSGSRGRLGQSVDNPNLKIFEFDVENTAELVKTLRNSRVVIHLASNPDIAKAAQEPRIDFTQGTVLTESVVEASRLSGIEKILYASGSGVYGDAGSEILTENSKLSPISTYGASKLAGEALLASYAYMFNIKATAFRFANVVGPRQTHGVGYDFVRRLNINSNELTILGNGLQEKSYVHVNDVVNAVLPFADIQSPAFDVYNISTRDSLSVNQIAYIAFKILGVKESETKITYTGGKRGWKADVPVVKLDPSKIESMGWVPTYTSFEAMHNAISSMNREIS
jgi:UDP-glucose 4-epimerase